MRYTNHHDIPNAVARRQEFIGSNIYGTWFDATNPVFVVYSYGEHFPIAAYVDNLGRWFSHYDKYSSSTSRHQSRVHRGVGTFFDVGSVDNLKLLIRLGFDPDAVANNAGSDLRAAAEMAPLIKAVSLDHKRAYA